MKTLVIFLLLLSNLSFAEDSKDLHALDRYESLVALESLVEYLNQTNAPGSGRTRGLYDRFNKNSRDYSLAIEILRLLQPLLEKPTIPLTSRISNMIIAATLLVDGISISSEEKETLRAELHPFLARFKTPNPIHDAIVKVYNEHDLWSENEFWFLRKKATLYRDSILFHDAIVKVAPLVSQEQLTEFTEDLQRVRPYKLMALMIQYELGIIEPSLYPALLRKLEEEYNPQKNNRSFKKINYQIPVEPTNKFYSQLDRSAMSVLQSLQEKYNVEDPALIQAYDNLYVHSESPEEKAFYNLFRQNDLSRIVVNGITNINLGSSDPLYIQARVANAGKPKKNQISLKGLLQPRTNSSSLCSEIFKK
jgi:hypothetical protein